jgi:competence protein ComFB
MARKSNKTAHVLNLLSGHDNQPAADETQDTKPSAEAEGASPATSGADSPSPSEAEVAASAASIQNISVIDTTGEDPVADLIQQKLSAQFEEPVENVSTDVSEDVDISEKMAEASKVEASVSSDISSDSFDAFQTIDQADADTQNVMEASPAAETLNRMEAASDNVSIPTPEPVPVPEPVSVPTPTPVTSVPIPDPESIPGPGPTTAPKQETEAISEPEAEPEPDFVYVNIMESIVKDKIIYFMRQFDVCTCERCVADTIALTMNGLMPRYIVTSPAAVDPLISFYTNKLISDVTVEATKACIVVKDNPRH